MNLKISFLIFTLMLVMLTLCEARGGGRRGGGGSFGGLFGNWRKSKKQSSSGVSSRRIASSIPSQRDNFLKSNNYYNNHYSAHLPTVGSYYHNIGILPSNQINSFNDYHRTRSIMTGIAQPYNGHKFLKDDEFLKDMLTVLRSIFQQPVSSSVEEPLTTVSDTFGATETPNTVSTDLPQFSTTETSMQSPNDTICMPMSMLDNSGEDKQVQVKKIICYPAPAQPSSQTDLESKPIEISGDIIEP